MHAHKNQSLPYMLRARHGTDIVVFYIEVIAHQQEWNEPDPSATVVVPPGRGVRVSVKDALGLDRVKWSYGSQKDNPSFDPEAPLEEYQTPGRSGTLYQDSSRPQEGRTPQGMQKPAFRKILQSLNQSLTTKDHD